MKKMFAPLVVVTAAMFAYAPVMIANAPYESTMLMVQKIFYFHLPSWMGMGLSLIVCGIASGLYLFKGNRRADRVAVAAAELAILFGAFGLVSGSLWARKAWGVWWQWDAKLTTVFILELILLAYMFLRKYGGPGAEKLAAGVALFGLADAVVVYKAADWWRTVHPNTNVMRSLGGPEGTSPEMWAVVWFCGVAFMLLFLVLLVARVTLEDRRAQLDELYLAFEERS